VSVIRRLRGSRRSSAAGIRSRRPAVGRMPYGFFRRAWHDACGPSRGPRRVEGPERGKTRGRRQAE
jgi:hypothetical protein